MKNLGIVLLTAGVLMMALTGFTHVNQIQEPEVRQKVASERDNSPLLWSPIIGTGLFVAGILVVVLGKK